MLARVLNSSSSRGDFAFVWCSVLVFLVLVFKKVILFPVSVFSTPLMVLSPFSTLSMCLPGVPSALGSLVSGFTSRVFISLQLS